jgi:pyruvate decarboxylase
MLSPPKDANSYPSNSMPVDVANMQHHKSYRVNTIVELDKLLKDENFAKADVIQLVEIVMPRVSARYFTSLWSSVLTLRMLLHRIV